MIGKSFEKELCSFLGVESSYKPKEGTTMFGGVVRRMLSMTQMRNNMDMMAAQRAMQNEKLHKGLDTTSHIDSLKSEEEKRKKDGQTVAERLGLYGEGIDPSDYDFTNF